MQSAQRTARSKATTEIGFKNRNAQVVVRPTGLPGTDHNQRVYELECQKCGHKYGANGSDISGRKCPNCQDGAPGLPTEDRQSSGAQSFASWTVANAKARLSEMLDKARAEGPQIITRNGKQTAVVVGIEEWERRTKRKGSLAEFLYNSPLRGADIDLERIREEPRDIKL